MAQESLTKSDTNSNLNSQSHIQLYQKVLYTGSQMAAMLHFYNRQMGLPAAAVEMANNWGDLMTQLAELLLEPSTLVNNQPVVNYAG